MKTLYSLLILAFCLLSTGCADVIVTDISNEWVQLNTPANQSVLPDTEVSLSWEYLFGAANYRVEVVQPDFVAPLKLIADSIIEKNWLLLNLEPGVYAWRVTALNDAYSSNCCDIFSFTVQPDTSQNLVYQRINLEFPVANFRTNENQLNFQWENLLAATTYRFQLSLTSNFSEFIKDTSLTGNTVDLLIPDEGAYYWRVRGESSASNSFTNYSFRGLTIDRTAPLAPVLVLPMNADTLRSANQTPDLAWESPLDSETDTVYIYTDVFHSNLYLKQERSTEELDFETSSVVLPPGTYYWRVRSVDAARNLSDYSILYQFIVP